MTHEVVLFDGRLGTQQVRVWLESRGGGIVLLRHDMGPALERAFGSDEIETLLEIDAAHLPALSAALGGGSADPIHLIAERYRGDSAVTSNLRSLLVENAIQHRLSVI